MAERRTSASGDERVTGAELWGIVGVVEGEELVDEGVSVDSTWMEVMS